MSTRPSSLTTSGLFLHIAEAEDELIKIKKSLIELHIAIEEVENSTFMVENHHRWAPPDADSHEILFERLRLAKLAVATRFDCNEINEIKRNFERVQSLLDSAKGML